MCTSRSNCKIQYGVNIGHPIVARNGVQDKLHLAPQDKMTALRTAKTLSPLVLFSIWRGPPSYGWWYRWSMSAVPFVPSSFSKSSWTAWPRPVMMPLSYIMYNIGMRDGWSKGAFGGSQPSVVDWKYVLDMYFLYENQWFGDLFYRKTEGVMHDVFCMLNMYFFQKMNESATISMAKQRVFNKR